MLYNGFYILYFVMDSKLYGFTNQLYFNLHLNIIQYLKPKLFLEQYIFSMLLYNHGPAVRTYLTESNELNVMYCFFKKDFMI